MKFKWGRGSFEKTPSPFAYFRNCFHRIERICSRVQGLNMQDYERDNILEQYEIAVNSTRKTRGAILCSTDKGVFLMREVGVSEKRLPALIELYEYFMDYDYQTIDMPVKNREGDYVTKGVDGSIYMLRRMPPGRECDVRRAAELFEAAGNLAKIHLLMRKKIMENVSEAENLEEGYIRHNRELRKVRAYIRNVSPKGEFEYLFLEYFDQMEAWADAAVKSLKASGYKQLYQQSIDAGYMVHGEYNYHNILFDATSEKDNYGHRKLNVYTVNFDHFKKNVQVEDLYYFLRKAMEKQGFKEWISDGILNAYSAIIPLGKNELEYLKNRLMYPEKFFKVANSYYHSNKAWISIKNVEKMQMAVRQMKEKEHFLNHFFDARI